MRIWKSTTVGKSLPSVRVAVVIVLASFGLSVLSVAHPAEMDWHPMPGAGEARVERGRLLLEHCICDHKQPCPCDLFKQRNICTCAGKRLESPVGDVQLTKTVEKAGCASKVDQAFLKQVLKDLPSVDDPRVLVGVPAGDDAGIYDMGDGFKVPKPPKGPADLLGSDVGHVT